jgi:glycosyltransferase involved in cell wall biosynthesis
MPFYCPFKTVVTLHDIAFEIFPESYSSLNRWYQRFAVKHALRYAQIIITPSQSTRKDLIRIYRANQARINTIYHGFTGLDNPAAVSEAVDSLRPYFLYVGRLESRKNSYRLVEAFRALSTKRPDLGVRLVLIGKAGYGFNSLQKLITRLPKAVRSEIIMTGYLSDREVATYLKNALSFVFPSLYEGFGIPLLEAMDAGVPVITSDVSSIPEVVDDAAILIDPQKTQDLAQAMELLATNELTRRELIKKGRIQAKKFSWEKAASETLAVLERVGEQCCSIKDYQNPSDHGE